MTGKSQDKPLIRESRQNTENIKYCLLLHNDEVNTFDYVIESLVEVCNHSGIQAEQCAMIAHYKGMCEIKRGSYNELKEMQTGLAGRGLISTIE